MMVVLLNCQELFRTLFGIIYAFGSNSYGQFGDRKSRSQALVVKGLDNKTTTQLTCVENFSTSADSSGDVYVWCSIEDGQIDPAIATVLYQRMVRERNERRRNENPYWRISNTNNNNDNNNGAPSRSSPNLREHIAATQARVLGIAQKEEKKKNEDSVTATTAANESGGELDDDNDNNGSENENKDQSKTDEENELSGDCLMVVELVVLSS